MNKENIQIVQVSTKDLNPSEYNPRKISAEAKKQLIQSIKKFGLVDPVIANSAPNRQNVLIGGNQRYLVAKELGYETIPVVYLNIPDIEREKELNIRLNKNTGEFDWDLLAKFNESFLSDIGFSSEELDEVFMCGDSMSESDVLKLMDGEKADFCLTDPPYILDYLKGKKKSKSTEGFGYKRDRHYLGTDSLPDNFTELWMGNINKISKKNFHIIVYENWKNLRTIWGEMEKHWKVKNMIVWHLPNRVQGFSAKHKFFNKHDVAMTGGSEDVELNIESEGDELLDNEYETALYAISGNPYWESYGKGKKMCPTDFIEYIADDAKSSGQGIIFGTKPLEILIPYIKVLTKRGDLIVEPFGGSGSTLIVSIRMGRRCFIMEKCPIYAEVIIKRWEKETGKTAVKIIEGKIDEKPEAEK